MADQQLQEVASRFHWPTPEPPTGSVVFWRGGIQPESPEHPRWEREYIPRSEAEALAEALEAVNFVNPPAALSEYRARHPKETP